MTTQELTDICNEAQKKINLSRAAFPSIMEIENKITAHFFYYYPHVAKIIARVPTRADFAPIRALKTGKWAKDIYEDEGRTTMRYVAIVDSGIYIDVRVCELPPSCRIVKEVVKIEACEAHTITRDKVICDPVNAEEALVSK